MVTTKAVPRVGVACTEDYKAGPDPLSLAHSLKLAPAQMLTHVPCTSTACSLCLANRLTISLCTQVSLRAVCTHELLGAQRLAGRFGATPHAELSRVGSSPHFKARPHKVLFYHIHLTAPLHNQCKLIRQAHLRNNAQGLRSLRDAGLLAVALHTAYMS